MTKYLTLLPIVAILLPTPSVPAEINRASRIISIIEDFALPVSRDDAEMIADALVDSRRHKKCRVSWDLLLAVAIQESKLDTEAIGINRTPAGAVKSKDHGLMQFNDKTIHSRNLDKKRLMQDVHYSVQAACELLSENKQKFAKKHKDWIGVYNAGTNFSSPDTQVKLARYSNKISKLVKSINGKYIRKYHFRYYLGQQ